MPDHYDVLTIAAIADELDGAIGGGHIQRIGLVDNRTLAAEIYANRRRYYLLASANDRLPRLRLAPSMPSLDPALITPFGLQLRKYLRGGFLVSVDQLPLDRVVRFSIARRLSSLQRDRRTLEEVAANDESDLDGDSGEESPLVYFALYVELMGRHSNLILVDDDGSIMESAKRVTPLMSRVRTVLPRHPYLPPPPPDRLDPRQIDLERAEAFLSTVPADADLAREIIASFRGISPMMAREVVFRAQDLVRDRQSSASMSPESLVAAMLSVLSALDTSDWQPVVYRERDDNERGTPVAFAAIPMRHLAAHFQEEALSSISQAAEIAEEASSVPDTARHAQRRQRLLTQITEAMQREEKRLASLANQARQATNVERLRFAGETIYAHLWEIEPGQTELIVDGERIALDPTVTPNENAQSYFERYRKAQSAGSQLPELEETGRLELAYLDQLATLVKQAPGFAELEQLTAEWAEHHSPPEARPRRKLVPRKPRALVDEAGNTVLIGRSGPQNDLLTFEIAGPEDTWLHARGVGGSHVIIRWQSPEGARDERLLEAAAALAAWHSAARESGAVEVDVAPRRYVRKIKGAGPGMVTYRNERTVRVHPAPEERLSHILKALDA